MSGGEGGCLGARRSLAGVMLQPMGVKVPIHPLHILSQATAARQHQGQEAGGHGCTVTIEKGGGRNGKLLMVPQPAGTPSSAPGTGMPTELRAECSTVVGKRLAGVEQFRVCCASITPARDEYIVRDEYIARLFFCFFFFLLLFFPHWRRAETCLLISCRAGKPISQPALPAASNPIRCPLVGFGGAGRE